MAATTASRCMTKQHYSRPDAAATGPPPSLAARPSAFARGSHNSACRLPCGLLPVRSPLLQESLLVSSPPPSDMLKSGGSSAAPPLSDTGSRVGESCRLRVRPRPSSSRRPRDPLPGLCVVVGWVLVVWVPVWVCRRPGTGTGTSPDQSLRPDQSRPELPAAATQALRTTTVQYTNDPAAGSPTAALLRLIPHLAAQARAPRQRPRLHSHLR